MLHTVAGLHPDAGGPSRTVTALVDHLAAGGDMLQCLNRLHVLVPAERLAMAGGCALNGVASARILRETGFTTPYLHAATSDDGTCLGAACYVWHQALGRAERFHIEFVSPILR